MGLFDSNGNLITSDVNPNFGSEATDNFGADAAVSVGDLTMNDVAIYPNLSKHMQMLISH